METIRLTTDALIRLLKAEIDPDAMLVAADDVFEAVQVPALLVQGPTLIEDARRRTLAHWAARDQAAMTFTGGAYPRLYHLDFDLVLSAGTERALLSLAGRVACLFQRHATQLDAHATRLDEHDTALATLDGRVDGHDADITSLDTRLEAHRGKGGAVHPAATQAQAGFMSATDKITLDALAQTAPVHTHDDRYYTEGEIDGLLTGYAPLSHVGAGGLAHAAATATQAGFMTPADIRAIHRH